MTNNLKLLKILFGAIPFIFLACGSDQATSKSKTEKAFGECTSERTGEVEVDSASGKTYFCENGKWVLEVEIIESLDTIPDGKYSCSDTSGNSATFIFREGGLGLSYDIAGAFLSQSSKPFSYVVQDSLSSGLKRGKDYSHILQVSSSLFPVDEITQQSFHYKYYDSFRNKIHELKCLNTEAQGAPGEWLSPFNDSITYGTLKDSRDGMVYKTIKVADLKWMAENLKFETEGSSCYAQKSYNCARYGRLYPWAEAAQPNICPSGWRVATLRDWDILSDYIEEIWNQNMSASLRSESNWFLETDDEEGMDLIGFSAVPGGYLTEDNTYRLLGHQSSWWTPSQKDSLEAWVEYVSGSGSSLMEMPFDIQSSHGIRCVEESERKIPFNQGVTYGSLLDSRDGKTYKTIKLGKREWMAENLNYKTTTGSVCYNNEEKNCNYYGRLYSWNTAKGSKKSSNQFPSGIQGVCPQGWHLPSNNEIDSLSKYVDSMANAEIGPALKAKWAWGDSLDENATNEFGFTALPGGSKSDKGFTNEGLQGLWWTTTLLRESFVFYYALSYGGSSLIRDNKDSTTFASVRCLKDFLGVADSVLGACTSTLQNKVEFVPGTPLNTYYTCDAGLWRYSTSEEINEKRIQDSLGMCTAEKEGVTMSAFLDGIQYFTCKSLKWERANSDAATSTMVTDSVGPCNAAMNDSVRSVNSRYYKCKNGTWGLATTTEAFIRKVVDSVGACTAAKNEEIVRVKYGYEDTYVCDSLVWRQATWVDIDIGSVIGFLGHCTASLQDSARKHPNSGDYYICDSLRWEKLPERTTDSLAMGACTQSREGEHYLGKYAQYWCLNSQWSFYLPGNFTDPRDGRVYKTTTFGQWTWLAENLKYDPASNSAVTEPTLLEATCPHLTEASCDSLGRFYTHRTARATTTTTYAIWLQGVCPDGWKLPTKADFENLENFAESHTWNNQSSVNQRLRAKTGWTSSANIGLDEYGFHAEAAGSRYGEYTGGEQILGSWWTSDYSPNGTGSSYNIEWNKTSPNLTTELELQKAAVRCFK